MASMKYYTVQPGAGIDGLTLQTGEIPEPGDGQVLVKLHAASLNFRDLMVVRGHYPGVAPGALVPLSDGAGEVVRCGAGSTKFKPGDRVAGIFMQSWLAGPMVDADAASGLGAGLPGVLAQYRVFDEAGLVPVPAHLNFAQAATLPCAGVTAWNALFGLSAVQPGQTVLVLGTGGVSIFALQLAHAAGARVIVTSSSDAKLERARALGAAAIINYSTTPDWAPEVRRLTGGRGVDVVEETGGAGTLAASVAATRRNGAVHMIGVLTMGQIDPISILLGGVLVRGVMVGSRDMFEALNQAVEVAGISPVIDRVFAFDEVKRAYEYLQAAGHMGKVVVTLD